MESPPLTVMEKLRIHHVVYTRAAKVVNLGTDTDQHWWVNFDGSWESLYFGSTKPFEQGDRVKITFEKVDG